MVKRLLNSALVFLSVCFVINLLVNGLVFIYYEVIGVPSTWLFHWVPIEEDIKVGWTPRLVYLLCLIEPLICIGLCLTTTLMLFVQGKRKPWKRLILIWVSIISASWFCGSFVVALFFTDFSIGTLYLWNRIDSQVTHFIFALLVMPIMVYLGYFHSDQFLRLASSNYWLVSRKRRVRFIAIVGLAAALIGIAIFEVLVLTIDEHNKKFSLVYLIRNGTSLVAIFSAMVFAYRKSKISISKYTGIEDLKPTYYTATLVILAAIFAVLSSGI